MQDIGTQKLTGWGSRRIIGVTALGGRATLDTLLVYSQPMYGLSLPCACYCLFQELRGSTRDN